MTARSGSALPNDFANCFCCCCSTKTPANIINVDVYIHERRCTLRFAGTGIPSWPGETGRTAFVEALKTRYEFEDTAAQLYAETALGSNTDNSAGTVRTNAERLIGTWRATSASSLADLGYGGNALSSRMEEWNFADDLTYTYRLDRQTSLMSPYGSVVRPSSTSESGLWVPSDLTGPQIEILLLRHGTDGRKIEVDWLGSNDDRPMECRIDGTHFKRL